MTINMEWLLITAAGVFIFSLFEAWIATLIIYGRVGFLRKIFNTPRNLIRSHVDYLMFTGLLSFTYLTCIHLDITLPSMIVFLCCFGAIYNPFGFFVQSIYPNSGKAETILGRVVVCSSFIPTTAGFGYAMVTIMGVLI